MLRGHGGSNLGELRPQLPVGHPVIPSRSSSTTTTAPTPTAAATTASAAPATTATTATRLRPWWWTQRLAGLLPRAAGSSSCRVF
jgi:hypothetical protein